MNHNYPQTSASATLSASTWWLTSVCYIREYFLQRVTSLYRFAALVYSNARPTSHALYVSHSLIDKRAKETEDAAFGTAVARVVNQAPGFVRGINESTGTISVGIINLIVSVAYRRFDSSGFAPLYPTRCLSRLLSYDNHNDADLCIFIYSSKHTVQDAFEKVYELFGNVQTSCNLKI